MTTPKMRWDSPGMKNTRKVNDSYFCCPAVPESQALSKNCAGCDNIVDKKCKFYKNPTKVKFPCSMRKN